MSLGGPCFHAWCDNADRVDAFAAALSALGHPKTWSDEISAISVEEAVSAARADFAVNKSISTTVCPLLRSGRVVLFDIGAYREGHERGDSRGPLYLAPDDRRELLLLSRIKIAHSGGGGARSVEVEAAVPAIQVQQDIEDLMIRLCAPDAHARVTTGACTWFWDWGPPVQACVTYHAEAKVARDLALAWIHLHDGDKTPCAEGMSLDALAARVEAAPRGSHVDVAGNVEFTRERSPPAWYLSKPLRKWRGDGIVFAGNAELTREQVLAALSTPPATVLDALEASAAPDDEWRAVEASGLEAIEVAKQGGPTYEVEFNSRRYFQFIQRHAPYHVRRLPNGGVVLATHPYRTLWPLWADALYLLGITP
jgi:hypothetical protein